MSMLMIMMIAKKEECMTLYDQVYDKALKKERSVCHTV